MLHYIKGPEPAQPRVRKNRVKSRISALHCSAVQGRNLLVERLEIGHLNGVVGQAVGLLQGEDTVHAPVNPLFGQAAGGHRVQHRLPGQGQIALVVAHQQHVTSGLQSQNGGLVRP